MAEREVINVTADTRQAKQNLNSLYSVLSDIHKLEEKASKSAGTVSENSQLNILNNYKQALDNFQSSMQQKGQYLSNGRGGRAGRRNTYKRSQTREYQEWNNTLSQTGSALDDVAARINKISTANAKANSSYKDYVNTVRNSKSTLSDFQQAQYSYKDRTTEARSVTRNQREITRRATDSSYMSYKDYQKYNANNKIIDSYKNTESGKLEQAISATQTQLQNKQRGLHQAKESGNVDEDTQRRVNQYHEEIGELEKLLESQKKYQYVLDAAISSNELHKQDINSVKPTIGAERGSLQDIMQNRMGANISHIVGTAFSTVRNFAKGGLNTNLSTGIQALNAGNLSGHVSSEVLRERLQNQVQRNHLGYSSQEALNFYSLASQRSGYNGNSARSRETTTGMTRALEQGGRYSGVNSNTYSSVATAAMTSGGLLTTGDVQELGETIAGENMRSGNKGDSEGNAKIIANAITQVSQSSTLGMHGINTMSATTAMLSRLGKSFQGKNGQQAISNINNGFQQAASGSNQGLLYMKIQSNPQKYGGVQGYLKAQESLAKGLGDPSNIEMTRGYVQRMGQSGSAGKAMAAEVLQKQFGITPQQSDKLATDMISGHLSNADIAKEARRMNTAGKQASRRNASSYQNDQISTLKSTQSGRERQESQMNNKMTWASKIHDWASSQGPIVGTALSLGGTLGGSVLQTMVGNSAIHLGGKAISAFGASKFGTAATEALGKTKLGSGILEGLGKAGEYAKPAASGGKLLSGLGGTALKGAGFIGDHAGALSAGIQAIGAVGAVQHARNKMKEDSKQTGGIAGSFAGAALGAKAGAAIGSIFPGAGTVIGGAVGGIAGGIAGTGLGQAAGNGIYNIGHGIAKGIGHLTSPHRVQAATRHNRNKNRHNRNRNKTTADVINGSTRAYNSTQGKLNQNTFAKNLYLERHNITKRENDLTEFGELLKSEAEMGGNGKEAKKIAGTIGNGKSKSSSKKKKLSNSKVHSKAVSGRVKNTSSKYGSTHNTVNLNIAKLSDSREATVKAAGALSNLMKRKSNDFSTNWARA